MALHTELNRVTGKETNHAGGEKEIVPASPSAHVSFKGTGLAAVAAVSMASGHASTQHDMVATHAAVQGHPPVPFDELERAVHQAVSSRLREIFSGVHDAAVPNARMTTAASSATTGSVMQPSHTNPTKHRDAFLDSVLH